MKRIALSLALILGATSAWAQDKLPLSAISDYFNELKTAQGSFSQINDDGTVSTGMLYLHRPGRMRFEYDPPNSGVVLAGGSRVTIYDPKSNQPPETYALKRTPLSVILARTVDLSRANMVVGHGTEGDLTVVRAQDPENPEYGFIDLMFSADPIALRKWVIHDGAGSQTTVILDDLKTGMPLSANLFSGQGGSARNR